METLMTLDDESICQVFGDDHERMGAILNRAIQSCAQSAPRIARARFYAYEEDLRRHMRAEEQVLFPVFEAHSGLRETGPTAVMRREHREIGWRLNEIAAALEGDADLWFVERQLLELRALLADHERREELVLFPACDRVFTSGERFTSVHALPNDAFDEAFTECQVVS